jgi:hypothetical protein
MTQTNTYDPENWLLSTTRALKEYAEAAFSEAWEIIMEFPSTDTVMKMVPLEKGLVHFEIDIIESRLLGFGENIGDYNYNAGTGDVQPQEAGINVINFDVGVWTSDRSGGTTSRMRAKQTLANLFFGKQAQDKLNAAVNSGDGTLEIVAYTGGRFVTDRINDVDVYRLIDSSLDVRVFSRTPLPPEQPAITETLIDDILLVPDIT